MLFVEQAVEAATSQERPHLVAFQAVLGAGRLPDLYGDLYRHPLFLQMIMEEVAAGTIQQRARAELIRSWIERKIRRDIGTGRMTPIEIVDQDTFIEQMMQFQERLAYGMTVSDDTGVSLTEHVDSQLVEDAAREAFRAEAVDIGTILGCSMLGAASPRHRGRMPIKFLLRICQEFFVAAHLARQGQAPLGYPEGVRSLSVELRDVSMISAEKRVPQG